MMKGQELSEAYASADVFVMPSETETLGFVVLEAMASGVPVVAVAAGGLTDIVQHNQTGAATRSCQLFRSLSSDLSCTTSGNILYTSHKLAGYPWAE
jgi:sulfoquinovosyltransferase